VLVVAAYMDGLYKLTLVLHIFCAIVGFGAVYLNALYGRQVQKRQGPEGLAVFEANHYVTGIGQYFIYGVFLFGILLVLESSHAWKFSQTWVWLAMLLYVIALGVSHGVLLPAVRRMIALMREMVNAGPPPAGAPAGPPPQAAEMAALGQRVGATGALLDVMVVVILVLMVWKPGA
jgi:hypothetical protein